MDQAVALKTLIDQNNAALEAAQELVYLANLERGIIRKQGKRGFLYYDHDGKRITDPDELKRIAALAIPPAYTDVLISPDPLSHLQATGYDQRGRKQYRYHPQWHVERGRDKFALLPTFAAALPRIREKVDRDLRQRKPGLEKALATVVLLLDRLFIRIGNPVYAAENGSFGLTTLKNRHVKIEGSSVHFNFKGKSGKEWRLKHTDRRISRAIQTLQELPGQQLFQYLDEDGKRHSIRSQDVNAYIREAAGADFSSRQFRTWGATHMAATALATMEPPTSQRQLKQQVNAVIDEVASRLVNTRAVCRSSYIHPRVFEDFETGALMELARMRASRSTSLLRWMEEDEIRVMRWLRQAAESAG
ncbi:DNA topoisomerase IB [Rhizobium arenae]|uniref:DNA topoisomerase IB n=1 Tax=Pararhizobium arenae TaxID=1856850 RepID=UPI0009F87ACB